MQTTTIEKVLADICNKHDLTSISLSFQNGAHEGYEFHSYAHWNGNGSCASGYGTNASEALSSALKKAEVSRSPSIFVPTDITIAEQVAA